MLIDLFLIAFSACFIVDFSGVIQKLNRLFHFFIYGKNVKYNGLSIPLISCSLCTTFWSTFFYCAANNFSLIYIIGIASINAFFSVFLTKAIETVYESFIKKIDKINEIK